MLDSPSHECNTGARFYRHLSAMALERLCIPLLREIIMPFAGYLVWIGHLNFWDVVIVRTFGNVFASLFAYYVGRYGGKPAILSLVTDI